MYKYTESFMTQVSITSLDIYLSATPPPSLNRQ